MIRDFPFKTLGYHGHRLVCESRTVLSRDFPFDLMFMV
jgi:hypothetical protein